MRREWKALGALAGLVLCTGVSAQTRAPGAVVGCVYKSSLPTLVNNQQTPLLCDVNGKLLINGGTTPGGASGQVQYNNAGAFGGMTGTSWNDAAQQLSIAGSVLVGGTGAPTGVFEVKNGSTSILQVAPGGATGGAYLRFIVSDNYYSVYDTYAHAVANGALGRQTYIGSDRITTVGHFGFAAAGVDPFNADVYFSRKGAASFQFGHDDAAAPVAQTVGVQSVVAGTTNTAGADWTIKGSAGTGTGVGGNILLQVAPAGGSGTAQNAPVTALTLDATTGHPIVPNKTVATLPTCNAGATGALAYVTDQLTACPALDGTFTGGGAVKCFATCNGTAWVH